MTKLDELKQIRLKPILIPPEHGIWGFTIEAILLGIFLSEGISKYFIAIMMILLPFAKQNLKIFLQDVFAKRTFLRKYVALFFLMLFGLIFLLLFYFAFLNALYDFWYYIVVGLMIGFVVILLEIKGFYQDILTEILGSSIPVFFAIGMSTTLENQIDQIIFIGFVLGFRNISSILITRKLVDFIKKNQIENFFLLLFIFLVSILFFYFFLYIKFIYLYIFFIYLAIYIVFYYMIQLKIIQKAQQLGWMQIALGIAYVISIIYVKINLS
jgi:hypothetical protein